MGKVMLISFDAVADSEFDTITAYPAIGKFMKEAAVVREADTVFLSNTYPIHTSVVTGCHPKDHGIISNTRLQPETSHPVWYNYSRAIRRKTLWQAAYEKGLKTAAVMWPVTAGAKEIRYNIPEIMARPRQNQMVVSMKAGSKALQVREFLRHGKLMKGIEQPHLDRFSITSMYDIIKEKQPDLMLLHLTSYDSLCHRYGRGAAELKMAYRTLDKGLELMLEAVSEDTTVIVFSDHGQLNINYCTNPNRILEDMELLTMKEDESIKDYQCFFECCGGSVYFHCKKRSELPLEEIMGRVVEDPGFGRFLTGEELQISGRKGICFGFSAKPGCCYEAPAGPKKGDHGYPLDYEDYKVFYAVKGPGVRAGEVFHGGSLLDIAPVAAMKMELNMPYMEKTARMDLFMEP